MQSVTYRAPNLVLTEHTASVPLDHADPGGERIEVFAREVADPEGTDRPFLVFFQGGPGFEATRPSAGSRGPGWLDRALQDVRVLLVDQRGTGRSTPVGALEGRSPEEQAAYLAHFRADSIVRDAECLREELGVDRWSVLGQSFGGLCVTTYLSFFGGSLREALITGGVPVLGPRVDEVYEATYARMEQRSRRYFERYPGDRDRIRALHELAASSDVRLPSGDRLTPDRVRRLGADLGMSDGPESLHHVLELPFDAPAFLHDVEAATRFSRNPIYAVLHEACWADGGATRWSAQRLRPAAFADDPELFLAEHVMPEVFEEHGALRPLRDAAHLLAEREWPRLYDEDALAANEVPVAAAVYSEDAYVERRFSEETAGRTGGMRTWLTSEYDHNGLREDGPRILGRLLDLVRGRA